MKECLYDCTYGYADMKYCLYCLDMNIYGKSDHSVIEVKKQGDYWCQYKFKYDIDFVGIDQMLRNK
jgi:hypothetical protein